MGNTKLPCSDYVVLSINGQINLTKIVARPRQRLPKQKSLFPLSLFPLSYHPDNFLLILSSVLEQKIIFCCLPDN